MEVARKFVSNARWAMVAKFISAGLAVPLFIILSRTLGPRVYGQFALAVSILAIMRLVAGSGVGHSTGRTLAELKSREAFASVRSTLTSGLLLQTTLASAVAAAVWLSADEIGLLFGARALEPVIRISALALIFFSVLEFSKAALQGLQNFGGLAAIAAAEYIGKLAFAAGLALLGFGLIGIWAGFTLALALSSIVALGLLLTVRPSRPPDILKDWRAIFTYSLPLMLTSAGFFIYTELDNLMIGYYVGAKEVGLYDLALKIARSVPLFAVPLGQAAAPVIVGLVERSKEEAAEFVFRLIKYLFALFLPGAVVLFVLGPTIVLIGGPGFAAAAPAMRVMSVFFLSVSVGVTVSPMLDYLGEAGLRARWMTYAVLVNVALNFIFIPIWGGVGAALATALTHGPFVLNNLHALAVRVGLSRRRLFGTIGWILLSGLVAGAAGSAVLAQTGSALAVLPVGVLLYTAFLTLSRVISAGEIKEVFSVILGERQSSGRAG